MLTHYTDWIFVLGKTWEWFGGDRCEMPDKEQCVYNLNGWPLCLPIRLTSYTSPLELRTSPLLTLLALCVCVYVCGLVYAYKHTRLKKSALWVPIWYYVHYHLFFNELGGSMFVHVCVCVGETKTKDRMGYVGEDLFWVLQVAHKKPICLEKNPFICISIVVSVKLGCV